MEILTLNKRLRIYTNYGIIGLIIIYGLLTLTDELLMIFIPLIFNFTLIQKFKPLPNKRLYLIGAISCILTTLIFLVQYQFRDFVDWGCIKQISDSTANISYASTFILFTLIIWEFASNRGELKTHEILQLNTVMDTVKTNFNSDSLIVKA